MRKPSLLVIFLTVFIDLIGFGIVLPLLPRYSEKFGAEGLMIGFIIASFSVMQFFFAPVWGKLSDRIGRRPVLLISNTGSTLSYIMFALAAWPGFSARAALAILLASRVFAGVCGANISVASAYIADITPREKRSKGMALIGVSFGLGFTLGPALGALSGHWFGLAGPGWVAAGCCGANLLLTWVILGESRQPNSESAASRPKLAQWAHTLGQPKVGFLIGLYFLATFCFACFESTFPLLVGSSTFHPDEFEHPRELARKLTQGQDPIAARLRTLFSPEFQRILAAAEETSPGKLRNRFFTEFNQLIKRPELFDAASLAHVQTGLASGTRGQQPADTSRDSQVRLNRQVLEVGFPAEIRRQTLHYDERHVGYLFAFCGLVSAFVQGGIIGRLVKRFGEPALIWSSLVVVAVSMAMIPYVGALAGLLLALALFSGGSGVNRAPTLGLISIHTPADEQGATLGVTQSAGTLARIFGPLFATGLYAVRPHLPYLLGAGLTLAAAALAWRYLRREASPVPGPGGPALGGG